MPGMEITIKAAFLFSYYKMKLSGERFVSLFSLSLHKTLQASFVARPVPTAAQKKKKDRFHGSRLAWIESEEQPKRKRTMIPSAILADNRSRTYGRKGV